MNERMNEKGIEPTFTIKIIKYNNTLKKIIDDQLTDDNNYQ